MFGDLVTSPHATVVTEVPHIPDLPHLTHSRMSQRSRSLSLILWSPRCVLLMAVHFSPLVYQEDQEYE